MKIGIIGTGNIGGTLAGLLLDAGYEVLLANSRGPESLVDIVAELGAGAFAGSVRDVSSKSDVVIEAIPFGKLHTLPRLELDGKILITAANYYPARDGEIDLGAGTQTEYLQRLLPETHIAKAFNTIYYMHLRTEGDTSAPVEARRVLPFAATDETAATAARELTDALGFGPLYLGDLPSARGLSETNDLLYNKQMTLAEAQRALDEYRKEKRKG